MLLWFWKIFLIFLRLLFNLFCFSPFYSLFCILWLFYVWYLWCTNKFDLIFQWDFFRHFVSPHCWLIGIIVQLASMVRCGFYVLHENKNFNKLYYYCRDKIISKVRIIIPEQIFCTHNIHAEYVGNRTLSWILLTINFHQIHNY